MDNPFALHIHLFFLIEVLDRVHPFLPCHFRKNMLRLSSTDSLMSKIDNLCLSLHLLSKSMLLLLGLLSAHFETLT